MKILLVDKQGTEVSRIKAVLKAFGHSVNLSKNYDAAQLLLETFHYDLVMVNLPKYDQASAAFIGYVKKQKHKPVIAMISDNKFSSAFRLLKFDPLDVIVASESDEKIAQIQHTLSTSFYSFELN